MEAPPETLHSLWLVFLPENRVTGQISLQAQEGCSLWHEFQCLVTSIHGQKVNALESDLFV